MLCMLEGFSPPLKIIGWEPEHLKMQKKQAVTVAPAPCSYCHGFQTEWARDLRVGGAQGDHTCKCNHSVVFRNR